MPIDAVFNYPAPVEKPRPIKARIEPIAMINLSTNTISGYYREWYENTIEGQPPILSNDRKPFSVVLSDAQMTMILGIVAGPAQEQGALVAGSTPEVTSKTSGTPVVVQMP